MFPFTKLAVLGTVILTVICGTLIDKSAPYFPIEISRTATGYWGRRMFPLGAIVSFAVALTEVEKDDWVSLLPFAGFMVLTIVDDETNWTLHNVGVLLMVLGIGGKLSSWRHWILFVLAFVLYIGRIVIKAAAAWQGSPASTINRSLDIMHGRGASPNPLELVGFRVAGTLQWAFLYMIMELHTA